MIYFKTIRNVCVVSAVYLSEFGVTGRRKLSSDEFQYVQRDAANGSNHQHLPHKLPALEELGICKEVKCRNKYQF